MSQPHAHLTAHFHGRELLWTAGLLLALVMLTLLVLKLPQLQALDSRLSGALALSQDSPARPFVTWITALGGGIVVLPALLILSLAMLALGKWLQVVAQWGGFLSARALTDGLKILVARPRPGNAELGFNPADWDALSFPSGHTTSAVFLYGFLVLLCMRTRLPAVARQALIFAALLVMAGVGVSRILLGMHFASDVAGGILSGSIGLMTAQAIMARRYEARAGRPAA